MHPQARSILLKVALLALLSSPALLATGWFSPRIASAASAARP